MDGWSWETKPNHQWRLIFIYDNILISIYIIMMGGVIPNVGWVHPPKSLCKLNSCFHLHMDYFIHTIRWGLTHWNTSLLFLYFGDASLDACKIHTSFYKWTIHHRFVNKKFKDASTESPQEVQRCIFGFTPESTLCFTSEPSTPNF